MTKKLYLLRNEGITALKAVREKTNSLHKRYDQLYQDLWNQFISDLCTLIQKSLRSSQPIELNLHDALQLEREKEELIKNNPVITLDSYSTLNHAEIIGVSRIFQPGGKTKIGIGHRPGYRSVKNQLQTIKNKYQNTRFILVDDDIFTGGTVREIIQMANMTGIEIERVVIGISLLNNNNFNIPVNAIYQYPLDEVLQLNDPRDFLFGAFEAGLVIKLSNSLHVRAPYMAPFVDVQALTGIPDEKARIFSLEVIKINESFFSNLEKSLGISITIVHMSKAFQDFLFYQYSIKNDTPLIKVCKLISKHLSHGKNYRKHCVLCK